jgi:hypothetical protein
MGVYLAGRTRSAEDQIWDHIDRMRDAGPVADSYLTAHEQRVWAIGTGRSATSGTGMSAGIAMACQRWIWTHLIAVSRWFEGTSSGQIIDDDRFMTVQRHTAS